MRTARSSSKFWLQISKEEQLRALQGAREDAVQAFQDHPRGLAQPQEVGAPTSSAVCDMVERTSTEIAPWTLVEADDKYFARVKVLRTLARTLEAAL